MIASCQSLTCDRLMWSMLMIYAVWRSAAANLALKSVRLISVLVGDISRDAAHLNVVTIPATLPILCIKLVWSFGSIGTATKQHRPTIMLIQTMLIVNATQSAIIGVLQPNCWCNPCWAQAILYVCLHAGPASLAFEPRMAA